MKSLKNCLDRAKYEKIAIGHFNISNVEALWAIFDAARELKQPVIIGVSEGERNFIGVRQAVSLVQSIANEYDYPIFINADHTHDFTGIEKAVNAGFDSVMIDGSKLPFDQNVELTKKCVDYVKKVESEEGRNILVEAEHGYIGSSSTLLNEVPEGANDDKTHPDVAKKFAEETGIDLFAPSVGNIHGIVKGGNPYLDIDLIKSLSEVLDCHLVLHGGSGISDLEISQGIKAGIRIVHVNTEIRKAFRDGLEESLKENDSVTPYKYMDKVRKNVYDVVYKKIKLFANL
ncbi:MAG: tagatose-bisphosphate aldolase [Candidatus Moraniibacteriota bacterium]|nr:MAG: tagatose-bisphosphate aldolase [Candidatus Moranbacteria bacterium]